MWELVMFVMPGLLVWAWFTGIRLIWRSWIACQEEPWQSPLSYSWRASQKYF